MSIPYVIDGETDLDSTTINPWIDRMNGDAGPLVNMRAGVTNVLDVLGAGGTIQDAIDEGGITYFPNRTEPYEINQPLILPETFDLQGGKDVVIKATNEMDAILWRQSGYISGARSQIRGIDLDANQLANTGLRIDQGNWIDLSHIQVMGFLDAGIDLGPTGLQVYEVTGRRIRVIGPYAYSGVLEYDKPDYGMRTGSETTDCQFSMIISKNARTCFREQGRGNWYHQCHGYGWEEPTAACDYAFHNSGSGNLFTQCNADGPQVAGYLFDGGSVVASTCFVLWDNESPPVDAVGFDLRGANYCVAGCVVSASVNVALASTNVDYSIVSWSGNIIAPVSRLTHVGGTHFGRSIIQSGLQTQGIVMGKVTSSSATMTVSRNDHIIAADASSGDVTIDLLPAAWYPGRELIIKRTDNSGNSVTVDAAGTDVIDGAGTKTIVSGYGSLAIVAVDTGMWAIVASEGTIS